MINFILKLVFKGIKGIFTPRSELSARTNSETGEVELCRKPMKMMPVPCILGVIFFSSLMYFSLIFHNNNFSVQQTYKAFKEDTNTLSLFFSDNNNEITPKEEKKPLKKAKKLGDKGLYIEVNDGGEQEATLKYQDNTNTTKINLNKGGQPIQ